MHDAISYSKPIDLHSCMGIIKLIDNDIENHTTMDKSNKIPKHKIWQNTVCCLLRNLT